MIDLNRRGRIWRDSIYFFFVVCGDRGNEFIIFIKFVVFFIKFYIIIYIFVEEELYFVL